eukprot:747424-Hanusia_phi.AAC.7
MREGRGVERRVLITESRIDRTTHLPAEESRRRAHRGVGQRHLSDPRGDSKSRGELEYECESCRSLLPRSPSRSPRAPPFSVTSIIPALPALRLAARSWLLAPLCSIEAF